MRAAIAVAIWFQRLLKNLTYYINIHSFVLNYILQVKYSYDPFVIQYFTGKGVIGLSIPGCPQTYEEPRSSSSSSKQQQRRDSHQKIRRFYKGDVIAIPPGIPYWTYNHGDEPLVAISLLDTSNFGNQLDSTPRVSTY